MKLALFIADPDTRINQQIALGLSHELQKHDSWQIIMTPEINPVPYLRKTVQKSKPLAVVIRTGRTDDEMTEFLASLAIPIIAVASHKSLPLPLPSVVPDEDAIGKMAADYLLLQRFNHFALFSFTTIKDNPRATAFREKIKKAGKTLSQYLIPTPRKRLDHPSSLGDNPARLLRWLQNLPKPCAVFAHSDQPGAHIIRICAEHNICVPEDISVLGVDNDALFCNTVSPNLASVHMPNAQLGAEAAKLIMNWKPGRRIIKIKPTAVIERYSIRSPAINDPVVNTAIDYLRTNVAKGVRAVDLQKLTGLSPQLLVYRFRKSTGRTPIDLILRERVSLARKLLNETDEHIADISHLCGFKSSNQFYVTFKRYTGMSPKTYRSQLAV